MVVCGADGKQRHCLTMLDQLPPEVVTRVCEHARKSDLYSLNQVSRRCHKLATTVLFRHVSLNLDHLQSDVTRWTEVLDRTHLWRAPRCITVANAYDPPPLDESSSSTPSTPGSPPEHLLDLRDANKIEKEAIPKLYVPSMGVEDPVRFGSEGLRATNEGSGHPSLQDSETMPLVTFLRKLSSLGMIMWYANSAPAPSLSLLFQNELSECGLHIRTFSVPYSADLQQLQSLIALPSLRSIWFQHTYRNRLQDLLQRVMKCYGTNLQEVRILHGSIGASPYGESSIPWNFKDYTEREEHQLSRLRSLQLAGIQGDHYEELVSWTGCADFSYLRHLSLEIGMGRIGLDILLAQRLSSLESLTMYLAIDRDHIDANDQYYTTLREFMCSIRPLSQLRLGGKCEAAHLKSILSFHAVALRTLYLVPSGKSADRFVFTASTVVLVTKTCKNVVELSIAMRRRWNEAGEDVAILQAIGSLPYLSDLHVMLDASDHELGPNTAMRLGPLPNSEGHVRDAFINSAIDADLAKAFFNTVVLSSSSLDFSPKTSRLRSMSLAAMGGNGQTGAGIDMSLMEVVKEVGRRWVVERASPDAELDARRDKEEDYFEKPSKYLSWNIKPMFRSVWPERGGYWFDEWHAFPLKSEE